MTIHSYLTRQKAIEILSDAAYRGIMTFNSDFQDALKLAISALQATLKREGIKYDNPH